MWSPDPLVGCWGQPPQGPSGVSPSMKQIFQQVHGGFRDSHCVVSSTSGRFISVTRLGEAVEYYAATKSGSVGILMWEDRYGTLNE